MSREVEHKLRIRRQGNAVNTRVTPGGCVQPASAAGRDRPPVEGEAELLAGGDSDCFQLQRDFLGVPRIVAAERKVGGLGPGASDECRILGVMAVARHGTGVEQVVFVFVRQSPGIGQFVQSLPRLHEIGMPALRMKVQRRHGGLIHGTRQQGGHFIEAGKVEKIYAVAPAP